MQTYSHRFLNSHFDILQVYFFRWQSSGLSSVVIERVYEKRRNESSTTSLFRTLAPSPFLLRILPAIFRYSGLCESLFYRLIYRVRYSSCIVSLVMFSLRQQLHSRQTLSSSADRMSKNSFAFRVLRSDGTHSTAEPASFQKLAYLGMSRYSNVWTTLYLLQWAYCVCHWISWDWRTSCLMDATTCHLCQGIIAITLHQCANGTRRFSE